MAVDVVVPNLPESVSDATLVSWHKQPGESVLRDENLVDLETDKVVLEVPAPSDGVIAEIFHGDGATVTAGELLARIEAATAGAQPSAAESAAVAVEVAATEADIPLSPAVRRLVSEHDLDPAKITGTGPNARIIKADVLAYMEQAAAPAAPAAPATPAPAVPEPVVEAKPQPAPTSPTPPPPTPEAKIPPDPRHRLEQRVPMTRLRARIAQRLLEAKQSTAMLTTFNEVNMKPVMSLRSRYKEQFEKTHGVRLGFMGFFMKAAVEALKRFPAVNGSIDGTDVIYHGYYDIGVAVSTERGLMVPILRDVDQMSLADIEKAIGDFATRGREGKIGIEELTGGTFSITNGGVFGSLMSTPILNPPQSAILGMHKTMERPMVENGQIVSLPMMYLALSYDHRIVDGREAVTFLVTIKQLLEDPSRLILQV